MSPEPRDSGVLLGLGVTLLLGLGFILWAVTSTSTPAELAELHDASGQEPTGLRWAAGPVPVEPDKLTVFPQSFPRPRAEDLLTGKSCIPLRVLFQNRPLPAEHSFSRDVACTS